MSSSSKSLDASERTDSAIVFGGSGFVGRHLIEDLTQGGAAVVCADVVRPESLPPGATFEYCDVTKPITISHDQPFGQIYNLAAIHRTPGHEPPEYYATNVGGAINIVDWMELGACSTLIFTSSISVYGPSEDLKTETTEPNPVSDYGYSKLLAENTFRSWRSRDQSRRLVIARPAVVFGPGEGGNFTRLARALRNHTFVYPGRADTIKSCGYVSDLVRALQFGADQEVPEILFNYCYPERSSIERICEAFHDVADYDLPHMLPPAAVQGVVRVLETVNPSNKGNVNAARVKKLTASTNIAVDTLTARGFNWETDLESALRAWRQASDDFT